MTLAIGIAGEGDFAVATPVLPSSAARAAAFRLPWGRKGIWKRKSGQPGIKIALNLWPLHLRIKFVVAIIAVQHPSIQLLL